MGDVTHVNLVYWNKKKKNLIKQTNKFFEEKETTLIKLRLGLNIIIVYDTGHARGRATTRRPHSREWPGPDAGVLLFAAQHPGGQRLGPGDSYCVRGRAATPRGHAQGWDHWGAGHHEWRRQPAAGSHGHKGAGGWPVHAGECEGAAGESCGEWEVSEGVPEEEAWIGAVVSYYTQEMSWQRKAIVNLMWTKYNN